MGWWMLWGGVLWIAVWAIVIYLVISLVRGSYSERELCEDPIEIVRRRYASGEIGEDEFERVRRDLAA